MANKFFCLSAILLSTLVLTKSAELNPESLISTLTQTSFQTDKACINQFNEMLFQHLQQIEGPEKAKSSQIHRIGKEVEEIISKKVKDMIWYCNGTSVEVSSYIVTHLHKNGRNLYIEQLAIQKMLIKPILKLDQTDVKEMEIIQARINEITKEKLRLEIANEQQLEPLNILAVKIRSLQEELRNVTIDRDIQRNLGTGHANAFREAENRLKIANNKYDEVQAIFYSITTRACGCQICKSNQAPNWNSFFDDKIKFLEEPY